MTQTPGFQIDKNHLICKSQKAIQGLKQSPRSWFHKLNVTLYSLGFSYTKSGSSLFIKLKNIIILYVLIYVDDIMIIWNSCTIIQSFIASIQTLFGLKDLVRLQYFLGMKATQTTNEDLHLSQTKYIKDILQKYNMLSSKPQPTPMISSSKLAQDGSITFEDPSLYRSIFGSALCTHHTFIIVLWCKKNLSIYASTPTTSLEGTALSCQNYCSWSSSQTLLSSSSTCFH